ncbi:MAG: hypothetical protein MJ062_07875 [Oscillospiraceae bacterium]|nr:hypothetical protein [Oscillospiraceae bacterium]
MDWKMWILCIVISVVFGAAWYGLYCLCVRARKKRAAKKGEDANIKTLGDWFVSLGMFAEVLFWAWLLVYRNAGI